MSITLKKAIVSGVFLLIYCLFFYFLITSQLRLDFSSFYSAAIAYTKGINPYQSLIASYFVIPVKLPANLNPPFFLQLMSPLAQLNYQLASSLWLICSIILGGIGALLSFKLTCSDDYFKKYWLALLFIYLGMFSTLMNTGAGQIGGVLLFFIMTGYYCYLRRLDSLAGIFWGVIIAIKLFPGLLFLFVFNQKRYKVFLVMLITCLLACLLPFLIKGAEVYSFYVKMLPYISWFGDNWNASLYGFIFRLFIDEKSSQNLVLIKITYLFFFIILLLWYAKKISSFRKTTKEHNALDHREFCLTLVMMLLMSPMGWIYYFSLLMMPLIIIWQSLNQEKSVSSKIPALWVLSLFLINFPIGYVEAKNMSTFIYKLSFFSLYFYGLVLITYLVSGLREAPKLITIGEQEKNMDYLYPLNTTLALGLFVTLSCLIIHLLL